MPFCAFVTILQNIPLCCVLRFIWHVCAQDASLRHANVVLLLGLHYAQTFLRPTLRRYVKVSPKALYYCGIITRPRLT